MALFEISQELQKLANRVIRLTAPRLLSLIANEWISDNNAKIFKKASNHYIPIAYNLIVVVKRIDQLANFLSTIVEWVSRKIYILSFTG